MQMKTEFTVNTLDTHNTSHETGSSRCYIIAISKKRDIITLIIYMCCAQ